MTFLELEVNGLTVLTAAIEENMSGISGVGGNSYDVIVATAAT